MISLAWPDWPIKPAYGPIIATGPGTYFGAGFGFAVVFMLATPPTTQVGIERPAEANIVIANESRATNEWLRTSVWQ